MSCHCINPQVFSRARNGITSTLSLKPGQALLFNVAPTEARTISLWVTSPWAQGGTIPPGPFAINLPANPAMVRLNFNADRQLVLVDGTTRKVLASGPSTAESVDFLFQNWSNTVLPIRNVTVQDPADAGTVMPTRTCFTTQTNDTGVDKLTACTACTEGNVVAGCVGFSGFSALEYLAAAAAITLILYLVKRFI